MEKNNIEIIKSKKGSNPSPRHQTGTGPTIDFLFIGGKNTTKIKIQKHLMSYGVLRPLGNLAVTRILTWITNTGHLTNATLSMFCKQKYRDQIKEKMKLKETK